MLFIAVLEVPTITYMSDAQRVREGESVTIECIARGIPTPTLTISRYQDLSVTRPVSQDTVNPEVSTIQEKALTFISSSNHILKARFRSQNKEINNAK